jgi:hypothetical protein
MKAQIQHALTSLSVVTTHQSTRSNQPGSTTLLRARAIMDKSRSHIALLDEEGVIIDINREWRQFGAQNRADASKTGVGVNYLKSCLGAAARFDEQARLFSQGLCSVMDGERDVFELDSLCQVDDEMHVFRGRVERLIAPTRSYYMVVHEDLNAEQGRASA